MTERSRTEKALIGMALATIVWQIANLSERIGGVVQALLALFGDLRALGPSVLLPVSMLLLCIAMLLNSLRR